MPCHKGAVPQLSPIWGIPSTYAHTLCSRTTKFDVETHMGRRLVLGVSHAPPQGGGSQEIPILGVPFYLCVHHLSQNYQIMTWYHVAEERVSWDQPRLLSHESRVPGLPNFGGSPVFMPTPFNAELPNSAMVTHMERGLFLGQPRHCICTNASRGLSAIQLSFLVSARRYAYSAVLVVCPSVRPSRWCILSKQLYR